MNIPLTGGCVCGKIRFEVAGHPLMMMRCHCLPCQKVSGGPYTPIVVVGRKHVKFVKGEPKYYATPSKRDGTNMRGFCADCGSRINGAEDETRPWMAFTAASFDDSSWFKPTADVFTSHAQIWDQLDPTTPQHKEYPPQ